MSARRQTLAQLAASGSLTRSPGRFAGRQEPAVGPLEGKPPGHLQPDVRAVWVELFGQAPAGVLGESDAAILEVAAVLLAQFRAGPTAFPTSRVAQLRLLLADLGLTPTSRSKTSAAVPPSQEPTRAGRRTASSYFDEH